MDDRSTEGFTFRIVFDGKERQLRLESTGTATGAGSWEALASWPMGDDDGVTAIRQAVDRLRAVSNMALGRSAPNPWATERVGR